MTLKMIAIAAGLAATVGTGAALAQQDQQGSYQAQYQGGYQGPSANHGSYQGNYESSHQAMHGHRHGVIALIMEEMRAGRISRKEGTLLEHKIHELRAEKRAARQARYSGQQGEMQQQH